ncbi:hypothetical protein RUND412_008479 [Rhizina undulata]
MALTQLFMVSGLPEIVTSRWSLCIMTAVPQIKVEPGLAISNSVALVPDFAPEPRIPPTDLELPKPSSEFPTSDKILEHLRLLCSSNADSNVTAEDIIVVHASTWDRYNFHWEYRLKPKSPTTSQTNSGTPTTHETPSTARNISCRHRELMRLSGGSVFLETKTPVQWASPSSLTMESAV